MRIAIIGAGLAGLALGGALSEGKHTVRLFEGRALREEEQGYYLGLEAHTGMAALGRLGLADAARTFGAPMQRLAMLSHGGQPVFELRLPLCYAPVGMSRKDLRSALLSACRFPVTWQAHLSHYEETSRGVDLYFADGTSWQADLLVGCDGVHSVVREQRCGDQVCSLGLSLIRGVVPSGQLSEKEPFTPGAQLSMGQEQSFFVQSLGPTRDLLWVYAQQTGGFQPKDDSPTSLLNYVHHQLSGWHEPIPSLLQSTPSESVGVSELVDRELAAPTRGGRVILLGDAAHAMNPYQGKGGNLALVSALDLAERLNEDAVHLPDQLSRDFEVAAHARAERPFHSSRRAVKDFHADNAVERARLWKNGPLV